MRFKTLSIALAILGFSSSFAAAQTTPQVYFGVHGGSSMGVGEIKDPSGPFDLDGLGAHGWVGGAHLGVDMKLPASPFFIGAYGGYDVQNTAFNASAGSSVFTAKLGDSWYAGGRGGFQFDGGAKIYGLAAYRDTKMTWTGGGAPELKGYDLGVGLEHPLAKNLSIGIEGIKTTFQDVTIGGPGSTTALAASQLSLMARLSLKFGGGESYSPFIEPAADPAACDPKLATCKKH